MGLLARSSYEGVPAYLRRAVSGPLPSGPRHDDAVPTITAILTRNSAAGVPPDATARTIARALDREPPRETEADIPPSDPLDQDYFRAP
jgi:hypothetical protein